MIENLSNGELLARLRQHKPEWSDEDVEWLVAQRDTEHGDRLLRAALED